MKKLLCGLLLSVLSSVALAVTPTPTNTATVNYMLPTANTDGSALAASSITSSRIEYGSCGATTSTWGTTAGQFTATGAATSATSPVLSPGTYCFRVYTTANGNESAASPIGSKVILPPTPNPPSNITVSKVDEPPTNAS